MFILWEEISREICGMKAEDRLEIENRTCHQADSNPDCDNVKNENERCNLQM